MEAVLLVKDAMLQWGRSVNAAETSQSARAAARAAVLQWGRSVNAAETG